MNIQISKWIRQSLRFALLLAAGTLATSCDENIVVGEIDESSYILANEIQSYIKDASTSRRTIRVELRTSANVEVLLAVTAASAKAVNAQAVVDGSYVSVYNMENFSSYEAFPTANVSIANSGNLSVAAWQNESEKLSITLQRGALKDGTYLLPVVIKDNNINTVANNEVVYYFVRVTSTPDIQKICIQNGKPLAHLAYTGNECLNVGLFILEDSKKPLFDYAVLFAAGPKALDTETGEVDLDIDGFSHILRNREKYIQPLQDKGIKVLLGILGGQIFGLGNMQGDQMKNFAAKVKLVVDTYGLDGIDLDDEYVSYPSPTVNTEWYPEWAPSAIKMGRLIIELRRIMPDKIISLYEYGSYLGSSLNQNNPVDGQLIRDVADMTRYPYYNYANRATSSMSFPNDRYSPVAFWIDYSPATNMWTEARFNTYFNTAAWIDGGYGHLYHYNVYADSRLADYFSLYTPIIYGEKVVLSEPLIPRDF
ncbi:MAG: DUF1735 domain-containing protein [Dysgonamonadaceae bacterium]|jgi:hypothetical protein|nr:DUF1735 domain-containing protein [Dysgonamonadaceae bacterium]